MHSPEVNLALRIMYNAHRDQLDKAGVPYVFHPLWVADHLERSGNQYFSENMYITALLHDVVEDSEFNYLILSDWGINKEVIQALKLLTHTKGMTYEKYIKNLEQNIIAKQVKIADLQHNLDIERFSSTEEAHKFLESKLYKRYVMAFSYLFCGVPYSD